LIVTRANTKSARVKSLNDERDWRPFSVDRGSKDEGMGDNLRLFTSKKTHEQ
jgi:hypothetical protein